MAWEHSLFPLHFSEGGKKQVEIDHYKSLKLHKCRRQLHYKDGAVQKTYHTLTRFAQYSGPTAIRAPFSREKAEFRRESLRLVYPLLLPGGRGQQAQLPHLLGYRSSVRRKAGKRREGCLQSQPPLSNISDHGRQARALFRHAQVCKGFEEKRSSTRALAK